METISSCKLSLFSHKENGAFQCNQACKGHNPFKGRQKSFLRLSRTGLRLRFCNHFLTPHLSGYGLKYLPRHLEVQARQSSDALKPQTDASSTKGSLPEEECLQMFLKEDEIGADFPTQVLRSIPSQVEPRYLIDGKLYTLREKEQLRVSPWKKIASALKLQEIGTFAKNREKTSLKQSSETPDQGDINQQHSLGSNKPVYLSDLLREYKGELYVPEEAFTGSISGSDAFQKEIEVLPLMTYEDFLRAVKANQVTLLTSRGVLGPGKFVYRDFIVSLKDVPGEEKLHQTKWALQLTEEEAESVLKEYTGPQVEIETQHMPFVVFPPANPNPVASSISGKVVLELAVASGLIATMAYTIGGFVAAVALMGVSIATVSLAYTVPRVLAPIIFPIQVILVNLLGIIGILLFGGFTRDTFGKRGLLGILSSIFQVFTSGNFTSSARLLAIMLFVGGSMAAIARFTLTRRPKDFTKWDLWQAIEFGQSKPQARIEGTTGVVFADIAGIDEVVEELQEECGHVVDLWISESNETEPAENWC